MPSTMRAAVVHAFDRPLSIDELAVPQPGPGEILVRIEASGAAIPTSTPPAATGR